MRAPTRGIRKDPFADGDALYNDHVPVSILGVKWFCRMLPLGELDTRHRALAASFLTTAHETTSVSKLEA